MVPRLVIFRIAECAMPFMRHAKSFRNRSVLAAPSFLMKRFRLATLTSAVVTASLGCGGGEVTPPDPGAVRLASIVIDGGPQQVERGSVITLTATARDTANRVVVVPLV